MNEAINILEEMQQECEGANRGFKIVQYAKVYRFATKNMLHIIKINRYTNRYFTLTRPSKR